MKQISFSSTKVSGFWGERQKLNITSTIPTVYKRFSETGRFAAFKCDPTAADYKKPHFFWDSDVAKWIEAVAYTLPENPDPELEKIIDSTVDLIEKNQGEDGYFNIYFTVVEPENRFQNRMCHELYCAGHLTEAAVAYYNATGKKKFLFLMEKYIDYIEKVFVTEDCAEFNTPGHEEIELALFKLWECTGNKKYFDLAEHFLNTRGTSQKDMNSPYYISHAYDQSHVPVREQHEAVGHSVRAMYLYCAMADYVNAVGDDEMKKALFDLARDTAEKKMYITGGIGASLVGEAFSEDFDLPNGLAYSETCAAIGLALFMRRMSAISPDSFFDDVAERAIYNAALAGISLDASAFFYEDPLEINKKERKNILAHRNTNQHLPITQRVEVFDCSCCPPNIARFVASIADFLYTADESTIYVHHFFRSQTEFDGIKISQETEYPNDGAIKLTVTGASGKSVAIRVPGWCNNPTFTVDGKAISPSIKNGFAVVDILSDKCSILIDFPMNPELIEANPLVENNFGRAAMQCGPIVYCLEEGDNPTPLRALAVKPGLTGAAIKYDGFFGMNTIEVPGVRYTDFGTLYRPFTAECEPITLKFIPYCGFANRGERDMLTWVRVKG